MHNSLLGDEDFSISYSNQYKYSTNMIHITNSAVCASYCPIHNIKLDRLPMQLNAGFDVISKFPKTLAISPVAWPQIGVSHFSASEYTEQ